MLGYLLVDLKRPYRSHNFSINAVDFPMTAKYKKTKFLEGCAQGEKPPLPPGKGKSKNKKLLMRVKNACTVYDTQNIVKF